MATTFTNAAARRIAKAVRRVERDASTGSNGRYYGPASPGFSGNVYLAGRLFSGLNATRKPWVKVDLAFNTVSEQDGPPPSPFPDGEEWYYKANTYGDIHVTRFG